MERAKETISASSVFFDGSISPLTTGKSLDSEYETVDARLLRTIQEPLIIELKKMVKDENRSDKPVKARRFHSQNLIVS